MATNKITVSVSEQLLEDAQQCAAKVGLTVHRFVAEIIEAGLAERRLDIQEQHQPPFLRNNSRSSA